jgi:hypothetical protein
VINGSTAPALLAAAREAFGGPQTPVFLGEEEHTVKHTDNLWLFFGRNPGPRALSGRPEHTDKIQHSGTWHAQLAGTKNWRVRPASGESWPAGPAPQVSARGGALVFSVSPGDVLLINTRLWLHATTVPATVDHEKDGLCFSAARDFYDLAYGRPSAEACCGMESASMGGAEVDMSNLDDTWATSNIARGTVISTDRSVKLPTSKMPNCAWIRGGRAGKQWQLVALRPIASGESMSVGDAGEEADSFFSYKSN